MFRRILPVAVRFAPALAPALYLQLHWTLPATDRGQDLAAMITGWYVVVCMTVITSARYLLGRRAGKTAAAVLTIDKEG